MITPAATRTLFLCFAAVLLGSAACGDATYLFDDVDIGGDEFGRAPRERSNSQYVRSLYADLVGRAPEAYEFTIKVDGEELARFPVDEQDALVGVLDGVGDPEPLRALLAAGLARSTEVELPGKADVEDPEVFIREQFRRFLGREPGAYELRAFLDEWDADPAVNPRTVVRALVGSREYQTF